MEKEKKEKSIQEIQTNLTAYSVILVFGILLATVLIPNFVKLKKLADFGPEKFPYIVSGILMVLGAIGIVMELVSMKKNNISFQFQKPCLKKYLAPVLLIISAFAFVFSASHVGFLPAAVIFTALWLFLFGSRKIGFNIIWAIVYSLLLYFLFSQVLGIRFTGGLF